MSLHRIGLARTELYEALVAILPLGRVSAYPRREDVGVQVWLDQTSGSMTGTAIDAEFPVHLTADGTDEAQVAALDDLVSRAWDACERGRLIHPIRWQAAPPLTVAGAFRRHQIITVRLSIAARTLCLPDNPTESPIPTDLVLQEA